MTAWPVWSVFCDWRDGDAVGDRCPEWSAEEETAAKARAYARRSGWAVRAVADGRRGDFCPKHRPTPGRPRHD